MNTSAKTGAVLAAAAASAIGVGIARNPVQVPHAKITSATAAATENIDDASVTVLAAAPTPVTSDIVRVIKWVDGDTFHGVYLAAGSLSGSVQIPWDPTKPINVAAQWQAEFSVVVRCYGINAPELHAPDPKPGQASKAFAEKIAPPGTVVSCVFHGEEKYGRALGEVILPDGRRLAQVMVQAGVAVEYYGGAR